MDQVNTLVGQSGYMVEQSLLMDRSTCPHSHGSGKYLSWPIRLYGRAEPADGRVNLPSQTLVIMTYRIALWSCYRTKTTGDTMALSSDLLKGQCPEIRCHFTISWIEAIWAPDKQAKLVLLKIRFCVTPCRLTLCREQFCLCIEWKN